MEYETLTGDEVRDVVLRGKKPARPIVNTSGGALGDQSVLNKSKDDKKKKRGVLGGLADKVMPTRGAKKE